MKTNVKPRTTKNAPKTREGGPASRRIGAQEELRRAVLSCMLWENGFYEDGVSIAQRIKDLIPPS